MRGMRWSVTITATSCWRARARASSPLPASSSWNVLPKLKRIASRLSCSSSTTSTGNFASSGPSAMAETVTWMTARSTDGFGGPGPVFAEVARR